MRKLHRYVLIVNIIRNNRYINLEDLLILLQKSLRDVNGVAISKRTVQRDIKEINMNIITIAYSRTNRGYFIPQDEISELEHMLRAFNILGEH